MNVIDFVGNHRMFLERLRALLSLGGDAGAARLYALLETESAAEMPEGCSVELELEAKALLARLFRVSGTDEVDVRTGSCAWSAGATSRRRHARPRASCSAWDICRGRLRKRHGSWFEFVRGESGLAPDELAVLGIAADFLRELEITPMTLCFKMVTLEVLLEHDALLGGMPVDELATRAHAWLRRSPELFADVIDDLRVQELDDALRARWIAYWKQNPIAAWTGRNPRAWFRIDEGRFRLDLDIAPELAAPLHRLTRELVDYRLVQYRNRLRRDQRLGESFVCRIMWNKRDRVLAARMRESLSRVA